MAEAIEEENIACLQQTIDKLRPLCRSQKLKKRLLEVENGLLAGIMPAEEALKAIQEIKAGLSVGESGAKNENRAREPLGALNRPLYLSNTAAKGKNNILSKTAPPRLNSNNLAILLGRIDSQLVELLMSSKLTASARLKLLLLGELRYELDNPRHLHGGEELLQELLNENLAEYERLVEAIKDITAGKNEIIRQAIVLLRREALITSSPEINQKLARLNELKEKKEGVSEEETWCEEVFNCLQPVKEALFGQENRPFLLRALDM